MVLRNIYNHLFHLVSAPPQINQDASPTPIYSFVGNRKPVEITCIFYGYPVPTVIMRNENGTEIAQGNSTASYTISGTTEDDFGTFNCTADSPDGKAEYLVELRKAGTHLYMYSEETDFSDSMSLERMKTKFKECIRLVYSLFMGVLVIQLS